MIAFLPAVVFAAISVTAEPRPRTAEVGDAIRVTVSVGGTGLTQFNVTPPKMPDGMEIGPAIGPAISRTVEFHQGRQVQAEKMIWGFDVTATRPGTFSVPAFTASNGTEVASSAPFEIRATGTFDARNYAFVETRVDPRPRYVGETITVTLAIGLEYGSIEDVLTGETAIAASWMFDGLQGGAGPESDPWPAAGMPNVTGFRTTSGKTLGMMHSNDLDVRKQGKFGTWTARRRFVAGRPGQLTIGPTGFRAVIGRNFQRDLFGLTREARDRKLALVSAPDVTLLVKPLPTAGRSDAFSGLVGRLALDVEAAATGSGAVSAAAPIKVKVGDSIRVKVRVSGDGNVGITPLPRVDVDGFKRFGVIEEVDANEEEMPSRTLVYDLAPVSTEVKQIPPFVFEVFDTATASYRPLSSPPIPVQVLPGAAISRLADATPAAPAPTAGAAPALREPSGSIVALFPGGALGLGAVFVLPALALGAFAVLGRVKRAPAATVRKEKPALAVSRAKPKPAVRTERSDPGAFAKAVAVLPSAHAERAKALSEAFAHHLAGLAGVDPETFVGADLVDALAPWVKETELRSEAAAIAAEADRVAFGGEPLARDLVDRATRVVALIERVFAVRSNPKR